MIQGKEAELVLMQESVGFFSQLPPRSLPLSSICPTLLAGDICSCHGLVSKTRLRKHCLPQLYASCPKLLYDNVIKIFDLSFTVLAVVELGLGRTCDEIGERLYCGSSLVCHRCAGQSQYTCVKCK